MRCLSTVRAATANRSRLLPLALFALLAIASSPSLLLADITPDGNVDPDPSTWTSSTTGYVGNTASGTLTVDAGSGIASSNCYLGHNTGIAGAVTVTGAGSSLNYHFLYIGDNGNGTLDINSGATVGGNGSGYYGYIGYSVGSSGTVTVADANSTWNNSRDIYVGYNGNGTLNITGGATVNSGGGVIAYSSGSSGSVTVDGANSTWNCSSSSGFSVGGRGNGTLNVINGGSIISAGGIIGSGGVVRAVPIGGGAVVPLGGDFGSSGTVTVDGGNSTWTSSSDVSVGIGPFITTGGIAIGGGTGTLNITNGGAVTVAGATQVATGTANAINFGDSGGTLTTRSLRASPTQLTGTGTINTRGLVSDVNLVFDSTHGLIRTVPGFGNVAVNLDMSDSSNAGSLGVDTGSLTIRDGVAVTSQTGYIGYNSGASGTAMVVGAGSRWNNTGIYVGKAGGITMPSWPGGGITSEPGEGILKIAGGATVDSGSGSSFVNGTVTVTDAASVWTSSGLLCVVNGRLAIANGAAVTSGNGRIGYEHGISRAPLFSAPVVGSGTVTVDGTNSMWTDAGSLAIGYLYSTYVGHGTLSVSGGGAVTAAGVAVAGPSLLSVDVGRGSSLAVGGGTGTITNNAVVRIVASASIAAGNTYTPISAGTWTGSGTYQAVGGTWGTASHQFTSSAVEAGEAGTAIGIDLAEKQRVRITDAATSWAMGASFLAATATTPLSFTGTAISGGALTSLGSLLGSGETVLSGWTLDATGGYAAGDPMYLSFGVGAAQLMDDMQVWQYVGGSWTKYDAFDATYDRRYLSLTLSDLGVYAVTGDLVLDGDTDRNGTVNSNDLSQLLTHYNQTAGANGWSLGDLNGDGTVNSNDLGLLLTHYNQTAPSTAAVPEPSTLLLAALGLFGLLVCFYRKGRG